MFNVAVINKKEILKYLVSITVTLCLVMTITRYFSDLDRKKQDNVGIKHKISEVLQKSLVGCLDETIPAIKEVNYELNSYDEEQIGKKSILGELLTVELAMFKEETKKESEEYLKEDKELASTVTSKEEEQNKEESQTIQPVESIPVNANTQIVTQNPLVENYNVECKGVKIKNETSYELKQELLARINKYRK